MSRSALLPALGERLSAIQSLVPQCALAAEIGADHGILSAHLIRDGIAQRMVVSDVSAASLSKARRLFLLHGLDGRAEFVVADGLRALAKMACAVVIAGMGAGTIVRMLREGMERIGDAALILQPNIDHAMLRAFLMESGFAIDQERLSFEGGRFYVAMRAVRGGVRYTQQELLLGPCLLRERPRLFFEYLCWRKDCLAAMRGEAPREMIALVQDGINLCR